VLYATRRDSCGMLMSREALLHTSGTLRIRCTWRGRLCTRSKRLWGMLCWCVHVSYPGLPNLKHVYQIWRLYIVWGSRKLLLVPLMTLLAGEAGVFAPYNWWTILKNCAPAMTISGVYFISRAAHDASIFTTTSFITTAFISLTMANCIICTGTHLLWHC
jgi:hypothetical protein